MTRARQPVHVAGVGAVSAYGRGVGRLRQGLGAGHALRTLELFDVSEHRTAIGGEVPAAAPSPDETRADAFAVAAAEEAVAGAGLTESDLRDAGVFFGSSTGGLYESELLFAELRAGGRRLGLRRLGSQQNNGPGDAVARRFGVRGTVETHSSACTSANMALAAALWALRDGEVELALCGGADGLCQITYAGFNSLRAVAPEPARPFRVSRDGLSVGEGAGVLVLETERHARARGARPLAELAGAGAACDAHHMSAPLPDGSGAAAAIRAAIADAGLDPDDIDFVNAHGTGTPHNDPAEANALHAVFGERARALPVTSTKAAVGHLLGACGGLEAVVTVLDLHRGVVHATPGAEPVDPELGVDLVTGAPRDLPDASAALSTNLAFGGNNCAVVFRRPGP